MSSAKKKTSQQTISISPELKDRIEKYVIENQKKNPKDKRFRSVSAFYTSVMEKVMDCFDKGKTLDDFDRFVDSEVKDLFERISFYGLIPYYENTLRTSRYNNTSLEKNPFFYFTLRRFYTSSMDPYDIKSIKNVFERIRNYVLSNGLTKEFSLDLFSGKGEKNLTAIFEQVGLYRNLSFENFKFEAALFGLLGAKITNIVYSKEDIYCRFDMILTDLFYRKELLKKDRIKLMEHNISHLLNYNRIVEDKDYFLWMKIAEDKNTFISFTNDEIKQDWITLIQHEIEKFGDKDDYHLNILRLFEKLHWIEIENEKDLFFRIKLPESKNQEDIDYLNTTLSKISEVKKIDGKYQLKKKGEQGKKR